jgi:xanthine dehydrogenase molybdopterin-binding subunit B
MIAEGETTRYIGDVLAGVVAETEKIARAAAQVITVDYEVLEPLTDVHAAETSPIKVHESGNLLSVSHIQRGQDIATVLKSSAHVVNATYQTQRVEHGFLETEAAIALPLGKKRIELWVQSQGVYEDQRQIARILGVPIDKVNVKLVPTGGGFGGKEDLTVQGHAAVFCFHLQKPVKVRLNRSESIRMHPKRHPFHMQYALGCDQDGRLTGLSVMTFRMWILSPKPFIPTISPAAPCAALASIRSPLPWKAVSNSCVPGADLIPGSSVSTICWKPAGKPRPVRSWARASV